MKIEAIFKNILIDSYICNEYGIQGVNLAVYNEDVADWEYIKLYTTFYNDNPNLFAGADSDLKHFDLKPQTYDKIMVYYNSLKEFKNDLVEYVKTKLFV